MGVVKLFLLLSFCFTENIESRKKYRYDYNYYPQIEGWLKLNKIPTTWFEAMLRCQQEGGELASPLNDAFLKTLKDKSKVTTWTGVHATFSKGDYFSIGGVPLQRMPISWAPGEPDNYENKEECIAMMPNGSFADVCCDELFPYFCFKKKGGSSVVNACGTVDTSYVYKKSTGSCYKFHNYVQNWTQAFMTCAAERGYLAIMNTAVESQILRDIFQEYPAARIHGLAPYKGDAFVGIHDWGNHGTWTTIHGESLENLVDAGVTSWGSGQPDNKTLEGFGQSCISFMRDGRIDDIWCHTRLPFFCEKALDSLQEDDDDY